MHVPEAAGPGEDDSAHHKLATPEALAPLPNDHGPRGLSTTLSDLEVSHFALSALSTSDPSTHVARLPLRRQPSALSHSQHNGSQSRRAEFGDIATAKYPGRSRDTATRRDSSHRSSSCGEIDHVTFAKRSSSLKDATSAVAKHTHIDTSPRRTIRNLESRRPKDYDSYYGSPPYTNDDTTSGAESSQQPASDKATHNHDTSSIKDSWTPKRPYSSSLGIPRLPSPILSTRSSIEIISDAGDQQQLRQGRRSLQHEDSVEDEQNLTEFLASLSPDSKHALQTRILAARVETRNSEGHKKKFIPKKQLWSVVNKEAVTIEIRNALPRATAQEIKSYVKMICKDVETGEVRNGRAKIRSFRKIFALLVLVEAVSSIEDFLDVEGGLCDQDLPLVLRWDKKPYEAYRRGRKSKAPLRCFNHEVWSPLKCEHFQDYQWWLLAPFFSPIESGVVNNYILQDEHILPFLPVTGAEDRIVHKTGGYGKVLMVQIHPDHHDFPDKMLCQRGFAIKQQLYDDHRNAFKREADILRKFSGERSHPHVVSLLATYEQHQKIHLMFYRAEGDLFEYWKRINPQPEFSYDSILWVAAQCLGITEGLSKLHKLLSFSKCKAKPVQPESEDDAATDLDTTTAKRGKRVRIIMPLQNRVGTDSSILSNGVRERAASPINSDPHVEFPLMHGHIFLGNEETRRKQYGRHGDINPGNILWYNDSDKDRTSLKGTLKIADFGQAEVNSYLSKTKFRDVANTLTYRPPECDANPQKPAFIRQSYDIWCLGCVYLEFVTWLLGGSKLMNSFAKRRSTADDLQYGQKTDTFFEGIRNEESRCRMFRLKPVVAQCIDELHEHKNSTEFLHDLLNMIKDDMLVVRSDERKSCTTIGQKLDKMLRQCQEDPDYAIVRNPWCIRNKTPPQFLELQAISESQERDEDRRPDATVVPTPVVPDPVTHAPAVQSPTPRRSWFSRFPILISRQ